MATGKRNRICHQLTGPGRWLRSHPVGWAERSEAQRLEANREASRCNRP